MKNVLLGGVLGGIIMFVWGAVSWTVFSWHNDNIQRFTDEISVTKHIQAHAPDSGVYIMPNPHKFADGFSAEQKQLLMQDATQRMKKGPFIFMSISKQGADPEDPTMFIYAMLINVLIAGLITWLLLLIDFESYAKRYMVVLCIGFIVAVMATFPQWNWWKFSTMYSLTNFVSLWATFAFAGLVIAWAGKAA